MTKNKILIYDTTLRDGTQGEQTNFSAEEKMRIAQRLDDAHFHYIEGGWPGSNPKDVRFFEMAKDVKFKNSRLTAFGSTRRAAYQTGIMPEFKSFGESRNSCRRYCRKIMGFARNRNSQNRLERKSGHDCRFHRISEIDGQRSAF